MILWWVGNGLLVLALPVVLAEAFRIIRSLSVITGAARDIAASVQAVSRNVPPVVASVASVADQCHRLEAAVSVPT